MLWGTLVQEGIIMYHTFQELLDVSQREEKFLWEIVLQQEINLTQTTAETIFTALDARYEVMCRSASRALETPLSTHGELITGISHRQQGYTDAGQTICGTFIGRVMSRALSSSEVNASMREICAAPTAGACGVLPAVLVTMEESYSLPRRTILEGLLTAAGVGAIATKNATVSGAEGGCQAECGVAASMAAAAAVYLQLCYLHPEDPADPHSNETAIQAAALALINCMGLVCDPVAGLVQEPCALRNASQAVNALISADLALSGTKSVIPPDEVLESMAKVGRCLPAQLRETARGGIAGTKTAKALQKKLFRPMVETPE